MAKTKTKSKTKTVTKKVRSKATKKSLMSTVKKGAIGGTVGTITEQILSRVPAVARYAKGAGYIAAVYTGGKPGVIGKLVIDQAVPLVLNRFGNVGVANAPIVINGGA